MLPNGFSDYIAYADESGDPSLKHIDDNFPVFSLAFCIFPIESYVEEVVPAVQRLKFDFFGHDQVILHANEIRRRSGPFRILRDDSLNDLFMSREHRVKVRARACGKRKAPTLVGAPPTGNKAQPEARAALAARADRESPAQLLASVVLQPNDFKVRGRTAPYPGTLERGQTKGLVLRRGPTPTACCDLERTPRPRRPPTRLNSWLTSG